MEDVNCHLEQPLPLVQRDAGGCRAPLEHLTGHSLEHASLKEGF